jgi:hypothetical protein
MFIPRSLTREKDNVVAMSKTPGKVGPLCEDERLERRRYKPKRRLATVPCNYTSRQAQEIAVHKDAYPR